MSIEKEKLVNIGLVNDNEWLDKYIDILVKNEKTKKLVNYTQRHHIIPKYYFKYNGLEVDNSINNVVNLSIEEHVLAHYYLCMCSSDTYKGYSYASINYILRHNNVKSLPTYEEFKLLLTNINENYLAYRKLLYQKTNTQDVRKKQSASLKKFYQNLDKTSTYWLDRNARISKANKGHTISDDTRKKMSDNAKTRTGALNSFYGKKHTAATKEIIAEKNGRKVVAMSDNSTLYFNSLYEARLYLKEHYNINTTNKRIIDASNKKIYLFGYQWSVAPSHYQQKHLSDTSRKKLAESAVKARGQRVLMQNLNSNVTIEFASLTKAATYIRENNIDLIHLKNIGIKIKKAALTGNTLYECKWNLIKL